MTMSFYYLIITHLIQNLMEARSTTHILSGLLALLGLLSLSSCEDEVSRSPSTPSVRYADVDLRDLPLAEGMLRGNEPLPEPEPIGEPGEGGEVKPTVKDGLKGVIGRAHV